MHTRWAQGCVSRRSGWMLMCILAALLFSPACDRRGRLRSTEAAYVSAQQAVVRDRLAQVYNKVGVVKNGERVSVLERQKRFARIRTDSGLEGWVEQRQLVTQEVYEGFEKLAQEHKSLPGQAQAVSRSLLNLHLTPARDSEHLFQLQDGQKVQLLKRTTTEKPRANAPIKPVAQGKPAEEPKPVLEDWWLVRGADGRAGWVLGRMVDVDAPMEIAQYAEGQRIVAYYVLNEVQDQGKKVPQYLTLVTEPKDGLPWDYNQIRIYSWNTKRHRYETAYRERNIFGVLPVSTGFEDFGKEGRLPVFTIHVQGEDGNVFEKKYKMIGPIVRRVLSAEEQQNADAGRNRSRAARLDKPHHGKAR